MADLNLANVYLGLTVRPLLINRSKIMIIKPKTRGFICTTTHPTGCEANVLQQINTTKALGTIKDGPKKVLVV